LIARPHREKARRMRLPSSWLAAAACAVAACSEPARDPAPAASTPMAAAPSLLPSLATPAAAPVSPFLDAGAAPDAAAPAAFPGSTEGCPDGMVRVDGEHCPAVMQDCLEHHKEYRDDPRNKNVSERCLRYAEPTRCVSKKREHLSFCVDRFEYPNRVGELPRVLTSWVEARATCESLGKRLCTEDEHNFVCEGPSMTPYAYGFVRDASKCNIDRPYVYPDHSRVLPTYDECLKTPWCAEELARLDQRHRIGERLTCTSWAGAFDVNGNVNEWVVREGEDPPNRSGLKGGWWGPVRSRCRPTVTFHKESDYGYEVGFRCCKDASG
jgi:hypothetical protein